MSEEPKSDVESKDQQTEFSKNASKRTRKNRGPQKRTKTGCMSKSLPFVQVSPPSYKLMTLCRFWIVCYLIMLSEVCLGVSTWKRRHGMPSFEARDSCSTHRTDFVQLVVIGVSNAMKTNRFAGLSLCSYTF